MAVFRAGEAKQALDKAHEILKDVVQEQYGEGIAQPSVGAADDDGSSNAVSAPGASPGLSTTCEFCGWEIGPGRPVVKYKGKNWHLACGGAMIDDGD